MARMSLKSPSSWATEINLQSRYPAGGLAPEVESPVSSGGPDAAAMYANAHASATTPLTRDVDRFMRLLLQVNVLRTNRPSHPHSGLAVTISGAFGTPLEGRRRRAPAVPTRRSDR